jgi:hypothetical protein
MSIIPISFESKKKKRFHSPTSDFNLFLFFKIKLVSKYFFFGSANMVGCERHSSQSLNGVSICFAVVSIGKDKIEKKYIFN